MRRLGPLIVASVVGSLLIALSPVATGTARSCSCAQPDLDSALTQADATFVGTLVEIRRPTVMLSSMDESRFVFDVETVYKGDVHERQSIVTVSDGASCGLELTLGTRAIVFARTDEYDITPDAGEYGANLCNGTAAFAGVPASFGAGTAPLPGSSPIGADDGWASRLVRGVWYVAVVALGVGLAVMIARRVRRSRSAPPAA
jgi:hypothetical protein